MFVGCGQTATDVSAQAAGDTTTSRMVSLILRCVFSSDNNNIQIISKLID